MAGMVHTLGDSTLDNLFWILRQNNHKLAKAKKSTVEGQLQKLCANNFQVISHAFDGFTTHSVLSGDEIGGKIGLTNQHYKDSLYLQEKLTSDTEPRLIKPLETLEAAIQQNARRVHYVVLSVGGNDFRENLNNPLRLLFDIPGIQSRYLQILDRIQNIKGNNGENITIKPILMLQYRTNAVSDSYQIYPIMKDIAIVAATIHIIGLLLLTAPFFAMIGKVTLLKATASLVIGIFSVFFSRKIVTLTDIIHGTFCKKDMGMIALGNLMQLFYHPILKRAREDGLQVIDLANTFNPYKNDLYINSIEPSEIGGRVIAQGIYSAITFCQDRERERERESYLLHTNLKNTRELNFVGTSNNNQTTWKVHYPK